MAKDGYWLWSLNGLSIIFHQINVVRKIRSYLLYIKEQTTTNELLMLKILYGSCLSIDIRRITSKIHIARYWSYLCFDIRRITPKFMPQRYTCCRKFLSFKGRQSLISTKFECNISFPWWKVLRWVTYGHFGTSSAISIHIHIQKKGTCYPSTIHPL